MDIMTILVWILVGLVLGVIAKMIMKEAMGWVGTIICGILGALVGGFIGNLIGAQGNLANGLTNVWAWVLSILGTVIVIAIYNMITRNSHRRAV